MELLLDVVAVVARVLRVRILAAGGVVWLVVVVVGVVAVGVVAVAVRVVAVLDVELFQLAHPARC